MEESQVPNMKQVIVMRHDLKMRRGKQIAQVAHASMSFLTRKLQSKSSICMDDFTPNEQFWIMGSFAKVCVRCNSEASKVAPVDKLSLVMVAIFATIFLGERPNMTMDFPFSCSLSSFSHLAIAMIAFLKLETHSRSIDASPQPWRNSRMVFTKMRYWLLMGSLCLAVFSTSNLVSANDKKPKESDETEITLKQLPKAVRKALKLATKNAEIEKIVLEVEDGEVTYEIKVEVEGGTVELCFNADGQIVGIEVLESEEEEDSEEMTSDEKDGEESEKDEASSEKIELKDVPESARKAIQKAAGDVKEIECEAITEAEVTVFEGAWMVGDVKMEITVSKAGDVLSQEKSLKLDQLPEALRTMATKFAGKDELKLEAKTVLLYELEVIRDGKTIEILVDATGREIKIIVGEDEDDDEGMEDEDEEDDDDK